MARITISRSESIEAYQFMKDHAEEFTGGTAEEGTRIISALLKKPVSEKSVIAIAANAGIELAGTPAEKKVSLEGRVEELEATLATLTANISKLTTIGDDAASKFAVCIEKLENSLLNEFSNLVEEFEEFRFRVAQRNVEINAALQCVFEHLAAEHGKSAFRANFDDVVTQPTGIEEFEEPDAACFSDDTDAASEDGDVLSIADAAKLLAISPRMLWRCATVDKAIKFHRVNDGDVLFTRSELDRFIAAHKTELKCDSGHTCNEDLCCI